jgi:hypothetical protein
MPTNFNQYRCQVIGEPGWIRSIWFWLNSELPTIWILIKSIHPLKVWKKNEETSPSTNFLSFSLSLYFIPFFYLSLLSLSFISLFYLSLLSLSFISLFYFSLLSLSFISLFYLSLLSLSLSLAFISLFLAQEQ